MRKTKGFTLVELLVVISIIALLLAILVPSLNRARELAKRLVCANHIHTFGVANSTYEATYGVFAPVAYDTVLPPRTGPRDPNISEGVWFSNKAFRRIMQTDSYRTEGPDDDEDRHSFLDAPTEFLCPSDKISKIASNISSGGVLLSYGYNMTEWAEDAWNGPGNTWTDNYYAGYGPGMVKHPADKLAFADGIDWWLDWPAADYAAQILPEHRRGGWDRWGQQTLEFYQSLGYYGPTFFRHAEGANVGFYDGHAEWMKKEAVFNYQDWVNGKPGMWAVNYP